MSDWNHQDLEQLLGEVQHLELKDPAENTHPSEQELDLYVEEQISPFLRATLEQHVESCEQCTSYLASAFDQDHESRTHAATHTTVVRGPFQHTDRRWSGLPWIMAAASWAMPMLGGAWMLNHSLATPVVIQSTAQPGPLITRIEPRPAQSTQVDLGELLPEEKIDAMVSKIIAAHRSAVEATAPQTVAMHAEPDRHLLESRSAAFTQEDLDEIARKLTEQVSDRLVDAVAPSVERHAAETYAKLAQGLQQLKLASHQESYCSPPKKTSGKRPSWVGRKKGVTSR